MINDQLVLIRADSSVNIGSGHIMRCLSLAEALIEKGLKVCFICCDMLGSSYEELKARGFQVEIIAAQTQAGICSEDFNMADAKATLALIDLLHLNPSWIVVDHYQLDAIWHRKVADSGASIAVIDDLADRHLDCDLLIDQNAIKTIHDRYPSLTPSRCKLLLGPAYTLLRNEFRIAYAERKQSGVLCDLGPILIFLGGADTENLSMKILQLYEEAGEKDAIHVLIGAINPKKAIIEEWCLKNNIAYTIGHLEVGRLLVHARAAIVACGMFAVELQALEIPCILIPVSKIQLVVAEKFAKHGRAIVMRPSELISANSLSVAIEELEKISEKTGGDCLVPLDGPSRIVKKMREIRS